jgi:hypothetical protein
MSHHLSVDVLGANTDFDFVNDAACILRRDQSCFKLVKFEISLPLNVPLEGVEELLFFISRFASVGETIDRLSLEVHRLIEIKGTLKNTLGAKFILCETNFLNGFVESCLGNGPSELNVRVIVLQTLLGGLGLL